MNTFQKVVIGVLAVLVLILGYRQLSGSALFGAAGPGPTHYQTENFLQGLYAGTSGQFWVSPTGTVVTSGGIKASADSTASVLHFCSTATTWNPSSISSSTAAYVATTTVSVAGPSVQFGDRVTVSLATSTSIEEWQVDGDLAASGTSGSVRVKLTALPGSTAYITGLNLATTTVTVCVDR